MREKYGYTENGDSTINLTMQSKLTIDLSGDVGEGAGNDVVFIPLLTSVNIACGGHAGDERTIIAAMETALAHGVQIGAHPGFVDREHYGRRDLSTTADQVYATVVEQLVYFQQFAGRLGAKVSHVKAHGALYHQTARDPELADALLRARGTLPCPSAIVGPWQSALEQATRNAGLPFIREAFADRAYDSHCQLVPRLHPKALITDPEQVIVQALQIIRSGTVTAIDGSQLPIVADTLCLHGDTPHSITIATRLREALQVSGINVKAI
jgi:5-oxoprolinase (ATP-hydrolysing) subunit A